MTAWMSAVEVRSADSLPVEVVAELQKRKRKPTSSISRSRKLAGYTSAYLEGGRGLET